MKPRLALLVAAGACALGLGAARANAAAAPTLYHAVQALSSSTSSNWSGYAVTGGSFTTVTGSWTQPAVTCARGSAAYSAFWVGLGGFAPESQWLEQIGTESDCTAAGQARYSAWYELVPAPSVPVSLTVSPGDVLVATVAVSGSTVTLTLADQTTGQSFTKTATVATPDTTSAEWIAEAPSSCIGSHCTALPLANFGTVSFTGASTTTSTGTSSPGTTGTIGDAGWNANAITLKSSGSNGFGAFLRGRLGGGSGSVTATPGALSPDGTSFSVVYAAQAPSVSTPQPRGHAWGWGRGWGRGHGGRGR